MRFFFDTIKVLETRRIILIYSIHMPKKKHSLFGYGSFSTNQGILNI